MELNIGSTIAHLRKVKGLTQEQLAHLVGVSTPAVSKWETNASYPDITLLAPIARALNTNIDTLLTYTEKLSVAQAAGMAAEVAVLAGEKGNASALARARELLCTYPENPALQFYLASILLGLQTKSGSEEERGELVEQAEAMLISVFDSGDADLRPSAAYQLASLYLIENELDRAEKCLDVMPGPAPDAHLLKAALCEKRGDHKKAKLMVQTNLYMALQKAETCLAKLMSVNYAEDAEKALRICEIHKKLAELMDYPFAMSDGLFAEVYMRMGQEEMASEALFRLAESLTGVVKPWGQELFSEMSLNADQVRSTLTHMRQRMLEGFEKDEEIKALHGNETFRRALRLLQTGKNT